MPDTERDNPDGAANDGALSFDDGVKSLSELFAPKEDKAKDDQEKATDKSKSEPTADNATTGEADEEQEATADAGQPEETEAAGEQPEAVAQAPVLITDDNALVAMPDGTKVSVKELRDTGLMRADYTRKSMDLGSEKQEVETQKQRVLEHATTVRQQRDLVIQYMQKNLPQPPTEAEWQQVNPDIDPVSFLGLQKRQREFDRVSQALQQLQQAGAAEEQQAKAEEAARVKKWAAEQRTELYRHHPELNDPGKRDQAVTKIGSGMRQIGFTDQEWQGYLQDPRSDHRVVRAMMLAGEYLALKAAKPAVQKQIGEKPKMLKPGKTASPENKAQAGKQAALEKLRKGSGSLKDGVDALLAFDNL